MDQDKPRGIVSDLTKPLGYGIWMVAATFLCAIVAAVILIVSTLCWPVIKEHGAWQLAIFAGSALLLGMIVFPATRRLEARAAAHRLARGEPARPTGVPTSSLVLGLLLFGGMGIALLWFLFTGAGIQALGYALFALVVASACARLLWQRFRRR